MSQPLYSKLLKNIRRAFRAPLPDHPAYQALLQGKDGIEIGGPTKLFRRDLPLYKVARTLDGVNFSATTVWEGTLTEGMTFRYMKRRVGRQFICDATDLSRFGSDSYDFLLSSNNLEHVANPLKAMSEWLRIVRPGGYLLLVLPRKESNFDHRREITPFRHLLEDFENRITEHDLTHLDEILELHDYAMTPDIGDRDSFERRARDNFANRCLHHHVFDMALMEQMFEHFGLRTVRRTTTATDYIAAAHKP